MCEELDGIFPKLILMNTFAAFNIDSTIITD